jgi:hypothetical protein
MKLTASCKMGDLVKVLQEAEKLLPKVELSMGMNPEKTRMSYSNGFWNIEEQKYTN